MSENQETNADENSREFARGVEAGLNSEDTKYWQAGYQLGQGLSDKDKGAKELTMRFGFHYLIFRTLWGILTFLPVHIFAGAPLMELLSLRRRGQRKDTSIGIKLALCVRAQTAKSKGEAIGARQILDALPPEFRLANPKETISI